MNKNPDQSGLTPWKPGQSGNPNGKPKGSKSLASIIRELEDEEFDWNRIPIKDREKMQALAAEFGPVGSPFRVMIYRALMDAVLGKGAEKSSAREFLRKAGYGDKLDITTKGKEIQSPLIVSPIKPRNVVPETETAASNGSDKQS